MSVTLEVESTLTDRYQTTVPETAGRRGQTPISRCGDSFFG
jgi:hypothetical protein